MTTLGAPDPSLARTRQRRHGDAVTVRPSRDLPGLEWPRSPARSSRASGSSCAAIRYWPPNASASDGNCWQPPKRGSHPSSPRPGGKANRYAARIPRPAQYRGTTAEDRPRGPPVRAPDQPPCAGPGGRARPRGYLDALGPARTGVRPSPQREIEGGRSGGRRLAQRRHGPPIRLGPSKLTIASGGVVSRRALVRSLDPTGSRGTAEFVQQDRRRRRRCR